MNALFLTNRNTLGFEKKITGGVQICSQEYYKLLSGAVFDMKLYYVTYTKKLFPRFLIKYQLDCYNMYNVHKDYTALSNYIKENKISHIFINLSSLMKYAKPIKEEFGEKVKVYLLSHGNDSGDFLHSTTRPLKKYNIYTRFRDLLKLGRQIHIESYFRINFLDGVFTVSEIEEQIENWLGAKKVIYLPRSIDKDYKLKLNTIYHKIGFIGRLDHPPNFIGFTNFCDELSKINSGKNFELALIGAPLKYGKEFENKYKFISYKGELLDNKLEEEISTWAVFLNPVYWNSMGVTTKIAKAIEYGVPVLTTKSGLRGYKWTNGEMTIVYDVKEMASKAIELINSQDIIENLIQEMKKIKESSNSINELSSILNSQLKNL